MSRKFLVVLILSVVFVFGQDDWGDEFDGFNDDLSSQTEPNQIE